MLVQGLLKLNIENQWPVIISFIHCSSAINVQLSDNTFSLAHFDIVGGSLKFQIPRIAP